VIREDIDHRHTLMIRNPQHEAKSLS